MSEFKLYDFSEQYENLIAYLEENPDLDEEMIRDTLESITDSAKDKINSIAEVLQKLSDDVDSISKRQKELASLKKTKQNNIDKLKDYLLWNMQRLELKKVDSGTRVVAIVKSPPTAKIHKPEMLPDDLKVNITKLGIHYEDLPEEYRDSIVESEVKYDYQDVLRYLKKLDKDGDTSFMEYAELVKDKHNVRIR